MLKCWNYEKSCVMNHFVFIAIWLHAEFTPGSAPCPMVARFPTVHIVSDGWLATLGATQRGSIVMTALHGGMRRSSGGSLVTYSSCGRPGTRTSSISFQTTTWDALSVPT